MENGIFTLEYFCRLCASEGVIIHPLFPPGDDDPKHELVRMIEVLTSVPLQRPADSGAVICDKCLQLLDLFCQFREECLRQDVLIRTKRTLIGEELVRQRFQQQQPQLLCDPAPDSQPPPLVEVKLEEDDETDTPTACQLTSQDVSEQAETDTTSIPQVIEIADCKEECSALENASEEEQPVLDGDECEHQNDDLAPVAPAIASYLEPTNFTSPAIALFSQAHGLSISVQVNQMSLDETTVHEMTNGVPSFGFTSDVGKRKSKKGTKENPGKEGHNRAYEPSNDRCQEAFDTVCEYDEQSSAPDRGGSTRCSLACDPCQMRFTKSYNLKRHMYEVHGELAPGLTVIECEYCGERFLRGYTLNRHISKMHSARYKNKKKLKILAIKTKA
ncbi:uncharacterized protein LOC125949160 [Anopheles darlingi]|uniref:uncharacterized protein LOC125949160 n=1 Tax=Anopheles darlingi TaxID=43151 RepID=UPI0021000F7E|nr:uncharacterized protein LOC125949160 [Anopheles darlingi]